MTAEGARAADSRRLDPLLRPRSVVVVGASPNPSFVSSILKNLLTSGYDGRVAAVNPRYATILDGACYPSVLDVPWPIDLAVVGVSWRQFPTLLEQCEQKQVGSLVVTALWSNTMTPFLRWSSGDLVSLSSSAGGAK